MARGNRVGHFEILGKDAAKAQKFYSDLFGWKIDANNPMNYGVVEAPEGGIGGGITNSMDGKGGVTVYVDVDDLQGTLDKAKGLGAEIILPPMEVEGQGGLKIAQFKDPDGNIIGVMTTPEM
jgi:predicted enzyme related to lactoylglutathione lyase